MRFIGCLALSTSLVFGVAQAHSQDKTAPGTAVKLVDLKKQDWSGEFLPTQGILSRDGTRFIGFARGSNENINYWVIDASTGKELWRTSRDKLREEKLRGDVVRYTISGDGKRVALTTVDVFPSRGATIIFEGETGKPLRTIEKNQGFIKLSHDGKYLAIWGMSQETPFEVRNTETGEQVSVPLDKAIPRDEVRGVDFSPDGKRIFVAQGTVLHVSETEGGKQLFRVPTAGSSPLFYSAYYSPNGKLLASCVGKETWICNAETGKAVHKLPFAVSQQADFARVAFSPDGRTIAILVELNQLEYWDTGTGKKVGTLSMADRRGVGVGSIAFSADGRQIAVFNVNANTISWSPVR